MYGWKKRREDNPEKWLYAHSNRTVNPENVSGFGKLGKGWNRFKVWETQGGVRRWLEFIRAQKIQPELGDILRQHCITPAEVHRTREVLRSRLAQIQNKETRMFNARDRVLNGESIDAHFPMNTKVCYWPEPCVFLAICPNGGEDYDAMIASDPVGSGEYEEREPHYTLEKVALKQ